VTVVVGDTTAPVLSGVSSGLTLEATGPTGAVAMWTTPTATDEQMLWYGIDRTNRQKTGEARVPHGQFPSTQASLASFRKLRATMLALAKTSPEDFRGRPFMGGGQDVYQWFLMISTHAQRHILQIREIKADPKFPGKGKTSASAAPSDR